MKRPLARLAILIAVCALSACGDDGKRDAGRLRVSAASSLENAFTRYGDRFEKADVSFSFAGSDELAAQIRQGATPDVFAAANSKLPNDLYRRDLVEKPKPFATNRLVLAVPSDRSAVSSIDQLARPSTRIAVGSPSVPVGAYTRRVLRRLGAATERAILTNVRSNEPDVAGVVGKLTQGAVDAGFVYVTDVAATQGRLRVIELPGELQPSVTYRVAVVKDSPNHVAARSFVAGLLSGDGARALRAAGFRPPPSGR